MLLKQFTSKGMQSSVESSLFDNLQYLKKQPNFYKPKVLSVVHSFLQVAKYTGILIMCQNALRYCRRVSKYIHGLQRVCRVTRRNAIISQQLLNEEPDESLSLGSKVESNTNNIFFYKQKIQMRGSDLLCY